MKTLISITLSLGLIGLLPGVASAAGDAAKGEALSATCAACHGAEGNSATPAFPTLAGLGEKYILKQLRDIKGQARPVAEMTGLLDGLADADLANLAAYYGSQTTQLSGAEKLQVQINSGAKVDGLVLGEKVYRAGNLETKVPACSGCHSPRGLGNAPAGFPRLSGQHAGYVAKQLKDFRAGNRTNDGDAMIMRAVAESMSDAEITAVANYIAGLN